MAESPTGDAAGKKPRPKPKGLSSSGKRVAALFAVVAFMLLPKRVRCGLPTDGACPVPGQFEWQRCEVYVTEPMGVFLVESMFGRDIEVSYSSDKECR